MITGDKVAILYKKALFLVPFWAKSSLAYCGQNPPNKMPHGIAVRILVFTNRVLCNRKNEYIFDF